MSEHIGRDLNDGYLIRIVTDGEVITAVDRLDDTVSAADPWLAPALWDLQVNGCHGFSFSDATLSIEQVRHVCDFLKQNAVGRFCPTLITASPQGTLHGVRTIAACCEADPLVARMVLGIHLEGPWISELEGYRGAHPVEYIRDPELRELERLQDASGNRIAMITLAPERPGSIEFIQRATAAGIFVGIGHTSADYETLRAANKAGARFSTHLGNGIASPLPRHPNPIWHQAANDRLFATLIADGHHLDDDTLKVLLRAKSLDRTVLISDLSPLADCAPGRYGAWEVLADGRIVVSGTRYLAGSAGSLHSAVERVARVLRCSLPAAIATATRNPARLLRRTPPTLTPGEPADLAVFANQ